jgi:hypothetical protein
MKYRPWGQLSWLVKRTALSWSLINSYSMEMRSIAAHNALCDVGGIVETFTLNIASPASRFSARHAALKEENRRLLNTGIHKSNILDVELFSSDAVIVGLIQDIIARGTKNVILDISCMPKRFFFPFLKLLIKATSVENLIAAYAVPEAYHRGMLAEDHSPLQSLPLFGQTSFDDNIDLAVIGVGFVPLGIASLLDTYKNRAVPVELLFPFPPGPPFYQRNWRFIEEIRHTLANEGSDPRRIHAVDLSTAFEHIDALCADGAKRAAFAPYGPKPISLAMALYAIAHDCPVYYTQPRVYHPEYSQGINKINGQPDINAYALRLNGHAFY